MDGEDFRTGSADSENGSEGSYVQVSLSPEDVPVNVDSEQRVEDIAVPSMDDGEDIYGDSGEQDETLSSKEPVSYSASWELV